MVRLQCLKLANSVKVGVKEETFLTAEKYDISLEQGIVIRIHDKKTKKTVFTTLMNTIMWEEAYGEVDLKAEKPNRTLRKPEL